MPGSEDTILIQPENVIQHENENENETDSKVASIKCKLDARGSISSVDSSISLSYDAAPFTPRGSLTTDDEGGKFTSSSSDNKASATDSSDADNESKSHNNNNSEDLTPFEPPDEELANKIIQQVEYYFSDENIVKDAFLLKHVRRNKEGYVSLKLIASFKRVKHIARDWRVVKVALEKSTKLQVNEAGTKLRRKEPLPLYDQTTPSRTVVAIGIPNEKATIEHVAELFRSCGEIALIRVLRPGNPIPSDVRPFYNKHPEMHASVSALIEFVRTESAHNALNLEFENELQVLELNAPASKKRMQVTRKLQNRVFDSEFSSSCQSGSEFEDTRYKQFRMERRTSSPLITRNPENLQRRWSRDSGSDSPSSSISRSRSNSGAGIYYPPEQRRRMSGGWESGSDSYGSCRSRSNSGVSIPEAFSMRRYSLPRREGECCCGHSRCGGDIQQESGRRYSIGRSDMEGGYSNNRMLRRNSDNPERKDSIPDYYPLHRASVATAGAVNERCLSFSKINDNNWSRNNSLSSVSDCGSGSGRRLSDTEGRAGLMRQRSFGNNAVNLVHGSPDLVVRLPRGPDNTRGFHRDLIEYPLPE